MKGRRSGAGTARRGPRTAAGALVALLVTADGAPAQGPPPAPAFPELPAAAPAGSGVTAPCLRDSLPGEVLCGRYRVLEDRDAPGGHTLDLAFVVMRALDGSRRGDAVTRFNGGPGGPVTPAAVPIGRSMADLREQRDILLVDHRGTGNSEVLSCAGPFPGGVESRFGTVFPLDKIVECRDRLAEHRDLSHFSSARAMDDLADLARWLGYSGLNLLGASYGTREAQIFYRRHPDLTRTLVLNGVVPVDQPVYVHHARYLEDALDDLFDECEATPACAEAYPGLRETSADVFAAALRDPPRVEAGGRTVRFGAGDLAYALRGLLYGASGQVPAALSAARAGEWQRLADFYLSRQAWVAGDLAGYHFSVLCAEDIERLTDEAVAAATAGTFMGDHLIGGYRSVCDLWPGVRLPEDHFTPVHGDVPTLLLSGGRDPVTPASGAEHVAAGLGNSVHVVVPNGGHGQGGPCIRAMIRAFVETASVGAVDASCVEEAPPTRFALPGG